MTIPQTGWRSDAPVDEKGPLTDIGFADLMASVGPFESNPRLAVAVSGGADSMALCLLAVTWAGARGGSVVALTVDHGLRPESAAEARHVGHWLKGKAIEHHVLRWQGPKPRSGLQAAAREARYDLMTSWCRGAGVLHLLLAHHLEDQGETFLLRLERHSGVDGLAAMSAVVETPAARLVRPLLGVSRDRLRATLESRGQAWIEDPSNANVAFSRTRVRGLLPTLAQHGLDPRRLVAAARGAAEMRTAQEEETARLLARCCTLHPAGFARIAGDPLNAAPEDVAVHALARILLCVGGRPYAPRRQKVKRLREWLAAGGRASARTLGGCRIVPDADGFLVCREGRGVAAPVAVAAGRRVTWDGRFSVDLVATGKGRHRTAWLVRLGRRGWAEVVRDRPDLRKALVPLPARVALPALRDDGVFAVPHLKYKRVTPPGPAMDVGGVAFRPPNTLSGVGFFLA